jgi:hypothetical protein
MPFLLVVRVGKSGAGRPLSRLVNGVAPSQVPLRPAFAVFRTLQQAQEAHQQATAEGGHKVARSLETEPKSSWHGRIQTIEIYRAKFNVENAHPPLPRGAFEG